ncbi:MAG: phytoene desaturase family protein [Solirubrobacteraceae bacterium]
MSASTDAIVIGSGHNGLVAAAYLARAGLEVEVLERNAAAGGAVASEQLTEPGYVHDTFSAWHPLFRLSATFAELGEELAARGLSYCESPDETTATVLGDGRAILAYRDPERTAEELDPRDRAAYIAEIKRFGETIPVVGELLGSELFSSGAARLSARLARSLGARGTLAFTADTISSARGWFESRFAGSEVADLYAPWTLHTGLPPEGAGSGFQALAIAGSVHAVGLPVVSGGSAGFVNAFERLICDHGGSVRAGAEVERIVVRGGRASGAIAAGEELLARRAVVANTTPTQLYGRLLGEGAAPAPAREQALRFRYGSRGGMQIHVALSEPLRWKDSRLARVPLIHLCGGLASVSLACAQASAGLLPSEPTVVVGQPTVLDPSRAPEGGAILWIQLQQVPYAPVGDAAGELDVSGGWEEPLTSAFVERVLGRLTPHVENWPQARIASCALSPVELERRNPNLVRGDIYSGDCELSQSYLWRPLPGYGSHRTPVPGLFHCGASTYPGPGLNAASGRIAGLQASAREGRLAGAARRLGKLGGR